MPEQPQNAKPRAVVGVRFRPAGRVYYYDAAGFTLKTGQWVIVEHAKGLECGRVVIAPRQVEEAELGNGELKPVVRLAEEDDLRQMLAFKAKEKEALRRCNERVQQHELPMKLAEAEYTYDGSRLTFYFTAEQRVDFRTLVRDLASLFHTRIELRQIGARDHAKLLGGVDICGKTLCCSSWLTEFNVVSIRMAKEQGLPLNTSKISGICGRLLCCLAYENDTYIEAKAQMPAFGEIVLTPSGSGRVVGVNVPRESVEVMLESGATVTTPLRELDNGGPAPLPVLQGRTGEANCNTCAHHKAPTPSPSRDTDSLN